MAEVKYLGDWPGQIVEAYAIESLPKRQSQTDQRRGRRRWLIAGMVPLLVIAGALLYRLSGPLAIAARSTRDFFATAPISPCAKFEVRGGDKVGGDEIVAMAGLQHGMNIWNIDPAAIEKKIAKHPWVRRVLVRREFPRRVVIDVEERTPKAIVAMRKLYYVDADGVVFKEVGPGESVKFPDAHRTPPEGNCAATRRRASASKTRCA